MGNPHAKAADTWYSAIYLGWCCLHTCFNPNAKAVDTWYSVKGPYIDNTHLDMRYI
jgi:hypothetical protein